MKKFKNNFNLPTSKNLLRSGGLEKQNNSNKLESFTKNKNKKKTITFTLIGLVLLVGVITLYRTFALYEEKLEFNVLHGKVPNYNGESNGDVKIAALIDGVPSTKIPGKNDGYIFENANCDNGAIATWDDSSWSVNIANLTTSKTTCTLTFLTKANLNNYLTYLEKNSEELVYDGTVDNNLRYIGANPNNYVLFNNELWRIIGVMNNITDNEGNVGSHIKIIRNESIGNYSWDNKASGIGSSASSYGSSDWTDSTLMEVLNSGAYWNRTTGSCPNGENGATISCNLSNIGLSQNAKSIISEVVWSIGESPTFNDVLTNTFYERERGKYAYSGHSTTWIGKIGLIYPSDYGYATSGGNTINRESCLNNELYNWGELSDCINNDWLFLSGDTKWTLTARSDKNHGLFRVNSIGNFRSDYAKSLNGIYPTLYLSSNLEITGTGDGSQGNPYILKS